MLKIIQSEHFSLVILSTIPALNRATEWFVWAGRSLNPDIECTDTEVGYTSANTYIAPRGAKT
jgi:hypothetical protein